MYIPFLVSTTIPYLYLNPTPFLFVSIFFSSRAIVRIPSQPYLAQTCAGFDLLILRYLSSPTG
jgi:hypothetical protein